MIAKGGVFRRQFCVRHKAGRKGCEQRSVGGRSPAGVHRQGRCRWITPPAGQAHQFHASRPGQTDAQGEAQDHGDG